MPGGVGVFVFHQQHEAVRVVARQHVERGTRHLGGVRLSGRITIEFEVHVAVGEQGQQPPAVRGLHFLRRARDLIALLGERGHHVATVGALAAGHALGQEIVAATADQHVRFEREILVDDGLAVAPVLRVDREGRRCGVVNLGGGHQADALARGLGSLHHRAQRRTVGRHRDRAIVDLCAGRHGGRGGRRVGHHRVMRGGGQQSKRTVTKHDVGAGEGRVAQGARGAAPELPLHRRDAVGEQDDDVLR